MVHIHIICQNNVLLKYYNSNGCNSKLTLHCSWIWNSAILCQTYVVCKSHPDTLAVKRRELSNFIDFLAEMLPGKQDNQKMIYFSTSLISP